MEIGTNVCILGRGIAAGVHEHTTVVRLTKTLIVTADGRRHRKDDHGSVPYAPYGGTSISTSCQRS